MLIKNIKIKNFRQYKDVEIEFSRDKNKNLTVILGENGYGKTTLIRAFLWCLYRDNGFKDKILLNQDIIDMMEYSEKSVKVEVNLIHEDIDYRITTKESYKKREGQVTVSSKAKTSMIKDGLKVPDAAVDIEISKILKKELKDYFFYDGENNTIESASKKGSLKEAVSQMMGIKKIETLRNYFNPTSTNGVISNLSDELVLDTIQAQPLQDELDKLINKKEEYIVKIRDNKKEIRRIEEQLDNKEAVLKANVDIQQDQTRKTELQTCIRESQNKVDGDFNQMISMMSNKKANPFLKILFAKCFDQYNLEGLTENSSFGSEESLSHISEEAIDQLIQRGKCLCGTIIEDGNAAYQHLVESKAHMEPHDFGKYLSDFISAEIANAEYSENLANQIRNSSSALLERIELIEINKEDIEEIKKRIAGRPDVGDIQREIDMLKNQKNQLLGQNNYIEENSLPDVISEIEAIRKKIEKASLQTKENDLIKKCISYAEAIYNITNKKVLKAQKETRKYLEEEVAEIFNKIYHGDRQITIDDNFDIKTLTNNHQLDNSTGTETVKNFAFVAGLLNSIKNHVIKDESNEEDMDVDESYPLIMDAPFSDIDAEHIRNICGTLPFYCDQICIVLIQKDYDVAIEGIQNKIGKLYRIDKHSETYGTIEEEEIDV